MRNLSRRLGLVALSLCLVGGAVGAVVWLRRPQPDLPVTKIETPSAEGELLAASNGLVSRDGAALRLRLKSGEILTLTDHLQCGDLACPTALAVSYRYAGWDEKIGGYRLQMSMGNNQLMVLTYGGDEPALIDARHPGDENAALPMPAQPPAAVQTDDSLAEWLADLTGERDQNEKPLIAAHAGQIKREADKLFLAFGDHHMLVLADDLVCGQVACPPQISRSFEYVGDSPDGAFHAVREEWNEAEEGLLIDREGAVLSTVNVPSFSPDGQAAVAVIGDLEGAAPRRLEVWGLNKGKATLVFSVPAREEDDTIYELLGWVDSAHLRLKRGPWGSDRRTQVMLVKDMSGWHIEEGDSAN